jgi:integrase
VLEVEKRSVQRCSERSTPHEHYRVAAAGYGKSPWLHRKADAQTWASSKHLQRASYAVPTIALREVANLTFRTYVEQRYLDVRPLKRSTRDNYVAKLTTQIYPRIGDVRMADLTTHRLRQVYVALGKAGLADSYIRNIWLIVAGVCKQAAEEDGLWAGRSPARGVRGRAIARHDGRDPLDPTDIPTPEECWQIIDAASERYKRMIQVAMLTGLRLQELCGLCPDALDPQQHRISVCRQLVDPNHGESYFSRPKSGRPRWVEQVPEEVFELLEEQQRLFPAPRRLAPLGAEFPDAAPPPDSTLIYINRYGGPVQRSHFVTTYGKTVARAGLRRGTAKARFHALRHVYASALIDAGFPITNVMRWMGHQSGDETLRTYARVFDAAAHIRADRASAFAQRLARPRHLRAI